MGPPDHVYMSRPRTAPHAAVDNCMTPILITNISLNQCSMFISYFVEYFRERRELLDLG